MAKTVRGEKTAAVQKYISAHPDASRKAICAALKRQGITITPNHVGNIKAKLKKDRKLIAKPAAAPAVVEAAPAKANGTITLDLIKKVASTVTALGGLTKAAELLEVIREAGGMKKFKDLAEAIEGPKASVVVIEETIIE
jgi:hypothetical protein